MVGRIGHLNVTRPSPVARRSFRGPSRRLVGVTSGVLEEARTRGFAAPAFAGVPLSRMVEVELRRGTGVVKGGAGT
jgi:hypothetical protein